MFQLQSYFLFLLTLFTVFIDANLIDPQVDFREKGSNNTSPQHNVTLMVPQKTNLTQNATQKVISEGGVEQVVEQPKTNQQSVKNVTSIKKDDVTVGKPAGNNTNITLRKDKPVHEASNEPEVPTLLHDFEKPIVPKKGVNFSESDLDRTGRNISAKTTNSSTIIHHKKPIFTESDSDFIDTNTDKENILTVDQIDPLLADKNYNRSDYIVPIVAVILSVPLVAILASLVYKRGADWWQHRNYKRMDFLIEGIYHHQ
ncbi:unnamed protein product [Ceutorhynchus assimilis]|uniref:24 kDa salivary protein n=1 Tax=Ceutorhynchus assimilis TaxID=467358 RepID=A0A9N9MHF7_9CUCU|nr:unnamed protein product [Ceutorhynchus assimilis]